MNSSRFVVEAGRVATPDRLLAPGWVAVHGAKVSQVGEGPPPSHLPAVDAGRYLLAPGFVDVHVHGGAGAQVNGGSAAAVTEAVRTLARFHARHGTTALLATTVSDTPARLAESVRGIAAAAARPAGDGATVLGVHLEGPWIAAGRAGAQNRAVLRPPDAAEFAVLAEAAQGYLRLVTAAPELPGFDGLCRAAGAAGVGVAIGHTDADYETARSAFDAGARHVTHLFNAMHALHHRRPGPAGAALSRPGVTVDVIPDGHHVHPAVLSLVFAAAPGRVVAVTDATQATGLPPGSYRLGDLEVDVREDEVTLATDPSVLAGSVLTLDRALAYLTGRCAVGLVEALTAVTATPAAAAGVAGKGRLTSGCDADLVALRDDFSVAATIVAGVPVHDQEGLFAAVTAAPSPGGAGTRTATPGDRRCTTCRHEQD